MLLKFSQSNDIFNFTHSDVAFCFSEWMWELPPLFLFCPGLQEADLRLLQNQLRTADPAILQTCHVIIWLGQSMKYETGATLFCNSFHSCFRPHSIIFTCGQFHWWRKQFKPPNLFILLLSFPTFVTQICRLYWWKTSRGTSSMGVKGRISINHLFVTKVSNLWMNVGTAWFPPTNNAGCHYKWKDS